MATITEKYGKWADQLTQEIYHLQEQLRKAMATEQVVDGFLSDCNECPNCGSHDIDHEDDAGWCEGCGSIVVDDPGEDRGVMWIDPVTYEFPEGTVDMFDHFIERHSVNTTISICGLWNNDAAKEKRF